ncbi:cell envelope integrity EipB family protein [Chelatococcus composti]|jgi:hypothetical protein|uniref:DUF1849 domain-containing protein n=1 Tax=Chelatococcus composti TaxID=1743235 RepID=A0A841K9K8_9HYPH|nr:cell envelope integrity EipB family protein [Chelatococcus composti]MBB6166726.1 hypothetical protein [Chelatococcus composti]MBS7734348.1 cell envelope integrity EipB family protein [Chelatococcus composti]PZN39985.1 MAG: DUF1849 domain-containing protein [Pseudomonadota bacterium]GGG26185.1 hypothetical protein GCM10008026_03080 [Chelatococcus composti]
MKVCLGTLLAIGLSLGSAAAGSSTMPLAPHRVVYDLSLLSSSSSRGVEAARGRVAFSFTGNSCEGYALTYRQVTVLEGGDIGQRTSDLRTTTFEDGKGASFTFKTESTFSGAPSKLVDGQAERGTGDSLVVRTRAPRRDHFSLDGDVLFPTEHLKRIIAAAKAGERLVEARVFDGSDDGRQIYDTLAIIGRQRGADSVDGLEEAARQEALRNVPRWPVKISYFTREGEGERTPRYQLSFELYENGISRDLVLDYGDFSLKGEMKKLEMLETHPCDTP